MKCMHCGAALDPRQAWRGSADLYFCSEFCADADPTPTMASPPLVRSAAELQPRH